MLTHDDLRRTIEDWLAKAEEAGRTEYVCADMASHARGAADAYRCVLAFLAEAPATMLTYNDLIQELRATQISNAHNDFRHLTKEATEALISICLANAACGAGELVAMAEMTLWPLTSGGYHTGIVFVESETVPQSDQPLRVVALFHARRQACE